MARSPAPPQMPQVQRAEQAAAAFPPLLVAAERIAATVAQGIHGRRRAGPGETFWQYRPYLPGDPAHAVDWRQTARGSHAFVREREWEAAQTVLLWAAYGPGMDWRSRPDLPTKRERAALLALALGALLLRGGERVGLLGDGQRPTSGRAVLPRLAEALEREARDDARETDLPDATAASTLPRHAHVVLIGDFLTPADAVAAQLRALAGHGVHGHLVQVLDPAEETLSYSGRVRFTAPGESGGGHSHSLAWLVNRTEDVREAYIARLHAHREALRALARSLGWSFLLHHTDSPPQAALLPLHQALSGLFGPGGGR